MGLVYRLEDYARYRDAVGEATCVDVTRRGDPARAAVVWERLHNVVERYGPPWVTQIWTKDVGGVLELGGGTIARLRGEGTTMAAQVTMTGLAGTVWEPLAPTDGVARLEDFARAIGGPEHITWRYDPIIPSVHNPERLARLARQVAAQGVRRGVINFIAPPGRYGRVDRRLALLLGGWGAGMPGYDAAWREAVAREAVGIAAAEGIALGCCAESSALARQVPGLRPAACGDCAWFASISGGMPVTSPAKPSPPRRRGSRPGCGCHPYFDVGSYGTFAQCYRCAYCYAG